MHQLKNLDRLKARSVTSSVARKPVTELSLENLRQVTGGCYYIHVIDDQGVIAQPGGGHR